MKTPLFFFLIVICGMAVSPYSAPAQAPEPTVQLIYFRANDTPPRPDVDAEIDGLIKEAQLFYADEMERHGFGRKTFEFETDANGNAVVHHVVGNFPYAHYQRNLFSWQEETREQIDISKRLPVYMIEIPEGAATPGAASGHGSPGGAHIYGWTWGTLAHELGHGFDLPHDFRSGSYLMSYGRGISTVSRLLRGADLDIKLSRCHAEWLDVYPFFNGHQRTAKNPSVKMLPPSLISPPNVIRLRFEITDTVGIRQALFILGDSLLDCKSLDGESNILEFVTSELTLKYKRVGLRLIDMHGNTTWDRWFSIDINSLLPLPENISVLDANLASVVREGLGLAPEDALTTHAMLSIRLLFLFKDDEVRDLTGLEHAHALTRLEIYENHLSDISALAGLTQLRRLTLVENEFSDISALAGLARLVDLDLRHNRLSDISALAGLTQLNYLDLRRNGLSDISALAGLTQLNYLDLCWNDLSDISALSELTDLVYLNLSNNNISDVSPLLALNLPGTFEDSTGLYLDGNPLSYVSIHTHIPAIQAKGVKVKFDNSAHAAVVKISGDAQEGVAGKTLAAPFIVEAQDRHGQPMQRVPVRFALSKGEGILSVITALTDENGRAQTTLGLGWSPGTYMAQASGEGIKGSTLFTATATELSDHLAADVNGDGVVDVEDLVFVAASFGVAPARGVMPNTDVNGDGEVNDADVALVLAALEGAPAAPALDTPWMTASLQRWIAEAKRRNRGDTRFHRGIAVLEALLADRLPQTTTLLANYPNPFNPETWIPYQLSEPTEVLLHIYSVEGALVRRLMLGHQPAGRYQSRTRAAYWDGKNEFGESVASGVYFYTLTAGDFTETRKMLIQK